MHEPFFVQANQVDGLTISACTTRTSNAVNIVFADVRDFVVHHVRQIVNVDSASCNVGRHQSANIAALEAAQGLCAGCLALVAVQSHRLNAIFRQKLGNVIGAKLGAGENQHLTPVVFLNDVGQQGLFLATADRVNDLCDALHRGVARRDLNALWVLEQRCGQFTDFVAESCREKQALLLFGHNGQYFLDVMDKAHVEHAVGFVKHQNFHLGQIQHALLQQVQQTSGCGHQNVHAFFHTTDLGIHADAAEDDGR